MASKALDIFGPGSARRLGNRYVLLRMLGDGGMASVYLGEDTTTGYDVAIKLLHDQWREVPTALEMFRDEALIQTRLQHPHVVPVFDFFVDDDAAAIVLQYIDGPSLDHVLDDQPLAAGWSLTVVAQVLDAISAAHQAGFVHRDIKPSNILLRERGEDPVAQVTDFGVARYTGRHRSEAGARIGTLAYMAPEHLTDPSKADARSDVYSVGITLYQMLSGRVPFNSSDRDGLTAAILHQPAPRLSEWNPSVQLSPPVDALLMKALAKDPDDRFQDCGEFMAALSDATAHFRPGPDALRPRSPVSLPSPVDSTLMAAAARRQPDADPSESDIAAAIVAGGVVALLLGAGAAFTGAGGIVLVVLLVGSCVAGGIGGVGLWSVRRSRRAVPNGARLQEQ